MAAIKAGMEQWTKNTCIQFKPRTTESSYANFKLGKGCVYIYIYINLKSKQSDGEEWIENSNLKTPSRIKKQYKTTFTSLWLILSFQMQTRFWVFESILKVICDDRKWRKTSLFPV